MRAFNGVKGLDSNIRQLENHKRTAIVAKGLSNGFSILKMLDECKFRAINN